MTILIWIVSAVVGGHLVATTSGSAEFKTPAACLAAMESMSPGIRYYDAKPPEKNYERMWAECLSKDTGAVIQPKQTPEKK
jgi:hypothetical protein